MKFIDVFAGCGGLSLGLLKAGFQGVAAIEKNPMAFDTLRHNLIDGVRYQFDWPEWLPKQAMSCDKFLADFRPYLDAISGTIDVMVGGPPCQGFSLAGKRDPDDPRNRMAEQYLELVKIIRPRYLVVENVSGFNSRFNEPAQDESSNDKYYNKSYAEYLSDELTACGYHVSRGKINCAEFGVPQNRYRYFIICSLDDSGVNIFERLLGFGEQFRIVKKLSSERFVSAHDAIADLEVTGKTLKESSDSPVKGFKEISYVLPDIVPPYLKLMRDGHVGAPNSLRLPNHKTSTVIQFIKIRQASHPGKSLSKEARDRLGLKKHAITVLSRNEPAPTITTLPDDVIHYSEPRILTARENARIQSFPDWFEFLGKYTTGGAARKLDCPRYTQIGNAVPPLMSEAIGMVLLEQISTESRVLEQLEK